MATAATSLLGLALPVTGELSGTWGDTVNVSITALLDTAVAGTTTLSSDADVTLTTTTLAANQARQAIILWTAGGTATRTITVPAQSKSYIVINKTSSSQSIKIVGVGPTTGVTIVAGTAAFVVWNGVDFVTASVTSTTGILPVANGGTGLSSGTSGGVLAYTATGTLASSAALAASALVIGGGAGAAPSTTTTGTGVVTALGVNTGSAGAFVVNGGALGSPSSVGTMPAFTLGGTVSGGGNQINNVIIGTTTPLAGAFTSLTASTTLGVTGVSTLTGGAVVQGLTVGLGGGAVGTNTAVGSAALVSNSSGTTNTAFGQVALYANSTGVQNTASGANALQNNSVGSANVAVGQGAMFTSTTASDNTAIGTSALFFNDTGASNTALGRQALFSNTTASNNTAVGYQAGYSNGSTITAGSFIVGGSYTIITAGTTSFTAIGAANNTPGTSFTATGVGSGTGTAAGNASNNTAVGYQALYANTTAENNTAIGYQAGNGNTTGAQNTFVGRSAGRIVSTGGFNTMVGYSAGNNATTGTINTFIGQSCGELITTGSKNTIIGSYSGNQGSLDIRTADNYIVLSDGDGNPRAYWNGANATFNGALALTGTLSGGTSGTGYSFSGSAPAGSLTLNSSGSLAVGHTSAGGATFGAANGANEILQIYAGFSSNLNLVQNYNQTSSVYVVNENRAASYSWKIGTASAAMLLDSSGNLGLGVTPVNAYTGLAYKNIEVQKAAFFAFDVTSAQVVMGLKGNAYYNAAGSPLYIGNGFATQYQSTSGEHAWYTAPSNSSGAGAALSFTQAMTLDASGNLGVGTTSPLTKVEARGTPDSNWGNAVLFDNRTVAIDQGGVLAFGGYKTSTTSQATFAQIVGRKENATSGNEAGYLAFITNNNTTYVERARIDSSGNLLVGATSNFPAGDVFQYSPTTSNVAICHSTSISSGTNYIGFLYNGSTIGSITQSGTTAVLYNLTSDQRLKENIQDAAPASALIDAIRVRQFDWKADGNHQRYGFIAQELVTVAPEAVHQPNDLDEMMAVDYSKLVPMLVKELQSLRARVAQLESKP